MAQAATMGPPLSPRETRRSGRRSAPSASASTSKSPDSPASESAPRNKDPSSRPALSISNSNGRSKRPKQEDPDDAVPHKNGHANGSASNHGNTNPRAKRKGKEKAQQPADLLIESTSNKTGSSSTSGATELQEDDAEEQGITRCICGMNEEDADGGEFMVQCETCNVWQHGLCMGFKSEEELQDDYHCEQCKPERHQELFKRLAKKARQSSTHSHNTTSRLSRSHSPTHMLKPSKRRNTMNSRDAAFDESIKEIIEATAAEAAAATESQNTSTNVNVNGHPETHEDDSTSRKKRKRTEEDSQPKKRTRSASSASDHPEIPSAAPEELPPPPPKRTPGTGGRSGTSRNRRGGGASRRTVAANVDAIVAGEGDEGSIKRSGLNSRSRAAPALKRPPPSHASGSVALDHSTAHKRHHAVGGGNTTENSRAYRNTHAYAVSQQPLFTSWNLPDYLAHLEHMLPTDTPRPLEVRSAIGPAGRDSIERTMERGVRVKWPSKRMSVGDMNKRVRALVEWVGREQAGALDRGRRREALEKALKEMRSSGNMDNVSARPNAVDGSARGSPMNLDSRTENPTESSQPATREPLASISAVACAADSKSTMKMMEELMEELICFQERFGLGIKNRDRERRPAS
ncbi:hypothetical protein V8B97DRAFT_1936888 [Scleroderma yunnanense]